MKHVGTVLAFIGIGMVALSGCSSKSTEREPEIPQQVQPESTDETEVHAEDFESGQVPGDHPSSTDEQTEGSVAAANSDPQ